VKNDSHCVEFIETKEYDGMQWKWSA